MIPPTATVTGIRQNGNTPDMIPYTSRKRWKTKHSENRSQSAHCLSTRSPERARSFVVLAMVLASVACGRGGGPDGDRTIATYVVGGSASDLSGTLVLQNNGGDDLAITADGSFAFATSLEDGSTYTVTVATPPAGQSCSVTNGDGTVSGEDVSDIAVVCKTDPDTTPPTAPGTPSDAGAYSTSTTTTFNWASATDAESGVAGYNLQVGTSVGGNQIFNGSVGDVLTYDAAASDGDTLYARVQAVNGAGLTGAWSGDSDGITLDATPPTVSITSPAEGDTLNGAIVVTAVASDIVALDRVEFSVDGGGPLTSDSSVPYEFSLDTTTLSDAGHGITATAFDAAGNSNAASIGVTVDNTGGVLPPDPADVATDIDPTVSTTMIAATEFLYKGSDPIQSGVSNGTIEPSRVAVLRGRVKERDGSPLSDVTVTILDHAEFGGTLTRADGMFDMAVNGGGLLTVEYFRTDYLPVQRQVDAPWQDYAWLPDVVMIPLDTQVTSIDLASAIPMQVAIGSPVTDADGTRRAVLMIPQGTTAEFMLPGGGTQALSTLNIRATEYTVGDSGPAAMPGELPATSGYTYAVELSTDEALAGGIKVNGKDVLFNQPVSFYVDNFLDFSVGSIVPVGYYDNDEAAWIPSDNGLVIAIVGITGGLADVDVDGDGTADTGASLSDLGITDPEREQLAALYSPGQSLWRVRLAHLSTYDCNWPIGPPPDAEKPPGKRKNKKKRKKPDDPCESEGSIIACQSQTLGQSVPVTGTDFTLNYRSDRVPGHLDSYTIDILLSEATIPASLQRIELEVSVAGQNHKRSFPPSPDQTYRFSWSGLDGYSRTLQGAQPVSIRTGYEYEAVYYRTFSEVFRAFGVPGGALTVKRARDEATLWQTWTDSIGTFSAAGALGGWSLDVHHAYDTAGEVLYLGDGARRSAENSNAVIETVAGNLASGFSGDNDLATKAQLAQPHDVATGPDGSIYIADRLNNRIRRIGPDGIITTVAGNGTSVFSGDLNAATSAGVTAPEGVAIGPDGSICIATPLRHRVRCVAPNGIINTVAGDGTGGFSGDGGAATDAQLFRPEAVAVGPDGSIYIADTSNNRIRRVGPDGIIHTSAGNGISGYGGDGGDARGARLANPSGVAVGADGSFYIADKFNHRIRKVGPDGIIDTIAGTGTLGVDGDGGPAVEAQVSSPESVAVGLDGSIYFGSNFSGRIRRIGPDGIITTVVGNGTRGPGGDGGPATSAEVDRPFGVAISPDDDIYIADVAIHSIRRVGPPLSGFTDTDIAIPSESGDELYRFDSTGRHLQTVSTLTGAVLYQFNYDANGLLVGIVDGDGNTTTIHYDASGNPTSIVAYGSQTTQLAVNADGYIRDITNPAGETTVITYANDGLLDSFTDPEGNVSSYSYDTLGRLVLAQDAAGGSKAFLRSENASGYTVTMTTGMGRVTTYEMEYLASDQIRSLVTDPLGNQTEIVLETDGSSTTTWSDGTILSKKYAPDPRYGMNAPYLESLSITTPAGLTNAMTQSRSVTLADPNDSLSLQTLLDTTTINGRTSTSNYDAASRTYTLTTPEGRSKMSVFDLLGRVTATSLASGVDDITVSYDSFGRVVEKAQGTQSWTYAYDALNRITSLANAEGEATLFSYDAADRTVQTTFPDGELVDYSYDANGNRTQLTMPGNNIHGLGYTARNKQASYTPPGSTGFLLGYDLDRALVRKSLPGGRIVTNSFSPDGRWTTTSYPEASVNYGYAVSSDRLTSLTRTPSAGGAIQNVNYGYDGGLMTSMTWSGVANGDFQYSYDNNFLLTQMILNSGSDTVATPIVYDADGLPTVYGPFTLGRDGPGGSLSQASDGAMTLDVGYDSHARVGSRSLAVNGSPVYGFTLVRDNAGRIVQKTETVTGSTSTYVYDYDANGRLTGVTQNGTAVEAYTYDANGNRLTDISESATYDDQDRLIALGGRSYAFDSDGYLTDRGGDSFTYSASGELLNATPSGGSTITYSYDGIGRMVGRSDSSGTHQYMYGYPWNAFLVTAVRDPGGLLTSYYYDDGGFLFSMERGGNFYYVGTDQVGTPLVVVDSSGLVVKTLQYDSFGVRISDSNLAFDLPLGFAGGLEDTATRLVRFGYRDFDQASGRWMARDPVLYDGGQANLYAYVGSDPVNLRDPLGLWCVSGSAYAAFGGGGSLCCKDGTCSICSEGGLGTPGASLWVGEGKPEIEGHSLITELSARCAGFGAAVKCSVGVRCKDCDGEGQTGPFKTDSDGNNSVGGESGCGLGGKVALKGCGTF